MRNVFVRFHQPGALHVSLLIQHHINVVVLQGVFFRNYTEKQAIALGLKVGLKVPRLRHSYE